MDPSILSVFAAVAAALGAAAAAYAGYVSARRHSERVHENTMQVLGDDSLAVKFEAANNTVSSIRNSIEHQRLGKNEIEQLRFKIKTVQKSYDDIVRELEVRTEGTPSANS